MNTKPDHHSLPARALAASFLLIAGGYLLNFVGMAVITVLLGQLAFPEALAIFDEPQAFRKAFEENPEAIFPKPMLWTLLVCCVPFWMSLGFMIVRWAPFGHFAHAVFLAVVLAASFFQAAIDVPAAVQTMLVIFMGVAPISVLMGGLIQQNRFAKQKH
jgi:hypothetical protein